MKKVQVGVFAIILIHCTLIIGVLYYVPYYVNSEGLSMVLIDANIHLAARLLLVLIITTLTHVIALLLSYVYPRMLESKNVYFVCRTFPMFPIIGLVVWMLFNSLSATDIYDYASLGINFVNANIHAYPNTLSHSDMISVGESLDTGLGFYLVWIITVLVVALYTLYYRHFNQIFNIKE